jgi:PAS domain S-box-containing protein
MVVDGQPVERVGSGVRQLFEGASVALIVLDEDGCIRYCNPTCELLLGGDADACLGERLHKLVSEPHASALQGYAAQAMQEAVTSDFEFRHDDDGTVRFLSAAIWPIFDNGMCYGAAMSFRDVSARIRRHESLGQRRKLGALARMAGSLAHHFNNILGSVVTRIDFVRNSHDIRALRRTLDSTANALQRATGVLDGLLAFAEADYRDEDLADLTETVINFIEEITPTLEERDIELQLSLPRVPIVEIPRQRFLTVLRNVVDNAIEAIERGGQIGVELELGDLDVTLRISDTGCGLLPEQLEQVFEPFYSTKTRDTAAGPERHAGLGLSVALGVVHELGGEMSLASKAGECTVAEIQIPIDPSMPLPSVARPMRSHSDLPSLAEIVPEDS